jgi:hypothetical protein
MALIQMFKKGMPGIWKILFSQMLDSKVINPEDRIQPNERTSK